MTDKLRFGSLPRFRAGGTAVARPAVAVREIHSLDEECVRRLVSASIHRENETESHVRRVGLLSGRLAEACGWTDFDVRCIRLAARLHDVGKIGVPDAVVHKQENLTLDELEAMQSHTLIGAELLAGSESPLLQMAYDIALAHHERWDGTGYPHGLLHKAIPEAARIVSIVDAYDVLTHDRPHCPALAASAVREHLQFTRGKNFDPRLLDVFLRILPEIRNISARHPDQ